MPLPTRSLTVVICDSDVMASASTASIAKRAGFEVVNTFENGPLFLQGLDFLDPSLAIITNELYGMSGMDVIEELQRREKHPESILISADGHLDHARDLGVIGVPLKGDLEALRLAIEDAKHLFESGERRSADDRRSGEDRRQTQDWSKVTQERRDGDERRKESRREEERTDDRRIDDGDDRREKQEWGKVTIERREGLERRK